MTISAMPCWEYKREIPAGRNQLSNERDVPTPLSSNYGKRGDQEHHIVIKKTAMYKKRSL